MRFDFAVNAVGDAPFRRHLLRRFGWREVFDQRVIDDSEQVCVDVTGFSHCAVNRDPSIYVDMPHRRRQITQFRQISHAIKCADDVANLVAAQSTLFHELFQQKVVIIMFKINEGIPSVKLLSTQSCHGLCVFVVGAAVREISSGVGVHGFPPPNMFANWNDFSLTQIT